MKPGKESRQKAERPITLKAVAEHVKLSPGTVSAVINDSPAAKHIPVHTRDRILAAVRELNYQPNFFARTLRKKRTYKKFSKKSRNEIGAWPILVIWLRILWR